MDKYFQTNAVNIPLKSESVDLVIADPPFGINFTGKASNYNRKAALVTQYHENQDQFELSSSTMQEISRVLRPTGTAWIIMGWNNLHRWEHWGQIYFPNQIGHVIWKYQFGVYAKKRPVVSHYHLLIFTKSNKWVWNQQGYDEDVWYIKRPYRRGVKKYPNRLPESLVEQIIIRSSNEGQIVYDPFVGSGTTVKVANRLGRIGLGSDLLNNQEFWLGA
jgi:site-specific DNA-methyltransferase (adenine-specific)